MPHKKKKTAPRTKAKAPARKPRAKAPLTAADILGATDAAARKARKPKRVTAKTLGVYDADRDILDQYLHEVSKTPLLTRPQEIAIARLVRAGDEDAMQELVKRNLRFVISVAKKYQNRGMLLTDLIGEGNVGLLTAARKFDPDQGVKFISYAVWWIRQAILAALARHGRTVRVPLNRTADLSRIVRTAEALRQELRREPTPEEISHAVGLTLEVVYFGLDAGREHTLEEIGGMLGVTRERVRQLRDRALKRLREGDVGRALASFAA